MNPRSLLENLAELQNYKLIKQRKPKMIRKRNKMMMMKKMTKRRMMKKMKKKRRMMQAEPN
jgi:hypothetical protein